MKFLPAFLLTIFFGNISQSQDSLITALAKNHVFLFDKGINGFSGQGWEKILEQARENQDVLIGEQHLTNEIPYFVSQLALTISFDNFICEIDPYSASILEDKIKRLPAPELKKYLEEYGNTFSFFALDPEFRMLQQLIKSGIHIMGTDQIVSVADRLVCSDLLQKTKNAKAQKIYADIMDSSKYYFSGFLKNQTCCFYMLTDNFERKLDTLTSLPLSKEEGEIIHALRLTARIYKEQSHPLRIQLMKNELMKQYPAWSGKKNLFRYGANHLAKGESLLQIYDIGNLVSNIADSRFQSSLHIMVVGKSGKQGSPFRGFPEQEVDEDGADLKSLKPLFRAVSGESWHCFDMLPLRMALEEGKILINNVELSRIIKGYDWVVIIPAVTASKFPETH